MAERPAGRGERPVNSLGELQLSEETLDSVMGHVARLGIQALSGWDAAAASLVTKDRFATFGITDDRINTVDQAQYDSNKGPCVDAAKEGELQYFNGDDVPPPWCEFARTAADAGVYSVISFPMKVRGETIGALNFYSRERDALRPGQREEGWVFASQAAVAVANAKEFMSKAEQVEQLGQGLETRTLIGQATGLLMAQEGLTSDEAFQKLVHVSQNANVKLREIAQRYVEAWEGKAGSKQTTS
ncbi:MAG: GAF and ANTAR domain-containing protein [Actinomycetota bacterium]|nr:GAF and ANTAR domain-containing protein [Actinomycetota bacterium]